MLSLSKAVNYSSFYTIYLAATQDLERNVYLIVFFPLNLHNKKTQHFFCSRNLFELEPRLRVGIIGA